MGWVSTLFNSHQRLWQKHGLRSTTVSNKSQLRYPGIYSETYIFCRIFETKWPSLLDPVYFGQPSWWTWITGFISELCSGRKHPAIRSRAPLQGTSANFYRMDHWNNSLRYRSSVRRIDALFICVLSVYIFSGSWRDRWFGVDDLWHRSWQYKSLWQYWELGTDSFWQFVATARIICILLMNLKYFASQWIDANYPDPGNLLIPALLNGTVTVPRNY